MLQTLALALLTSFGAHAALTTPYAIDKVSCKSDKGLVVLRWNFSQSPFVHEILVNGQNEIAGITLSMDPRENVDTYAKAGVFSLSYKGKDLTEDGLFNAKGSIGDQETTFACKYKRKWHITK